MFDFKNFSPFFQKGSTVFNYKNFKEDKSIYSAIATIVIDGLSSEKFDEIEKCNVYLRDGRVLTNVFVFNSSMLLYMTYWSANQGFTHDVVEKYLFELTESIFHRYNFKAGDILKIGIVKDKVRWKKIFKTKFNDNDLLVRVSEPAV